jgi:uncharacterized membrane protein
MAQFERSTTIGVGADTAYAFFADADRLPAYVPTLTHVETTVVDGADSTAPTDAGGPAAIGGHPVAEARFLADRVARRIEWSLPGTEYAGSIEVAKGTTRTSQVTIRLTMRDDVDAAGVERMLDEAIRNIRRAVSAR